MKLVELVREFFLNLLIPFIYLGYAILLVVFKEGNLPFSSPILNYLVFIAFIVGASLWLFSYFYRHPSVNFYPTAKELVTTGPYRLLRHPIYSGVALTFLSLSLLVQSWPAFWYALVVILPVNFGRARWEEKIFTEAFAEKYRRYQKETLF
ncbi:hypothetical protein A2160_00460 [Candidatus Beckwithbacteria bacterium RBG_13_42_9]|uniref:Isoprenylcysteine carboxylmethyltransferase family protein n=1 Tax=Candidatus Beckwithbacteria bacterium RBG_13_42_9 TaxID=1797457 RepID=A0A1F5E3S1_9BACT|nr:MAG: hypothetical protein A2160_00460 [Candidatus Beckwithbacteria bacterium RBG_13_42_9]